MKIEVEWDPVTVVANSADDHGDPSVGKLLVQIVRDLPSEMWGWGVVLPHL